MTNRATDWVRLEMQEAAAIHASGQPHISYNAEYCVVHVSAGVVGVWQMWEVRAVAVDERTSPHQVAIRLPYQSIQPYAEGETIRLRIKLDADVA